jgi:hypothetical protein
MLQSSDQPTTQTTAPLTSKPTTALITKPLLMLVTDTCMVTPYHTTHSRPYRFLTHGLSVSDIPSADTNRCSLTSLSQRLSVSDRVVTPSFYKLPLSQRLSDSDRVVTQPYNKYSSQMLLHPSADPTVYHIIYPGDTTHKMPEDCCLEGWPSLQCLLCLDRYVCHRACVCFLAIQHLTAAFLIHSSLANESNLNCWEQPSRTVSLCMSVHSRLRRFVTPTLDFDKRVWFS